MQDYWYADHLDLVKWGILFQLAHSSNAARILQLAFNPRTKQFDRLVIDGQNRDIPQEVVAHFRDLQKIGGLSAKVRVTVFDPVFNVKQRHSHGRAVCRFVSAFSEEPCVVFLDPDKGLEPQAGAGTLEHVLEEEAQEIWGAMKEGDVFALFQHRTMDEEWIERKREQLEVALRVPRKAVKTAKGESTAPKAAIYYILKKRENTEKGEADTQATVPPVRQPPKLKTKRLLKPCAHGCGLMGPGIFRPGHDAKYKSVVLKVERGKMEIEELPPLMREQLKWATTGNGLKCLNPITKIHQRRRNLLGGHVRTQRSKGLL